MAVKFAHGKRGRHESTGANNKKIDWITEIKKALLTSFVFLIASTLFLWSIRQISPGEFTGSKLERYLLKQVSNSIGVVFNEGVVYSTQREDFKVSVDANDSLVLCGSYIDETTLSGEGRFVSIFERRNESAWNALFGTKAKYELVFSCVCYDTYHETLVCEDCFADDINQDGISEIIIHFRSRFASRESTSYMFLQKGERWTILTPELSELDLELKKLSDHENFIMLDEFIFSDLTGKTPSEVILYGQYHHGGITITENPFWGGADLLYCIGVIDNQEESSDYNYSIYIMERLTDHGLFKEPNWNMGQILYVNGNEFDEDADVKYLWGYHPDVEDSELVLFQADVS